jgi:hypothetical protein
MDHTSRTIFVPNGEVETNKENHKERKFALEL